MGILYLVATPIGNLEDISARAIRILKSVNLIAAEDTRQTRVLLERYHISTPVISYHEHSTRVKLEKVMLALEQGDVALVSDAGTPGLNDPGYDLVSNAIEEGNTVTPIPGPCAPIAALVASGLPTDSFLYLGFLPRKQNQRRTALLDVVEMPFTLIFLETPHRLLACLNDLDEVFGDRDIAIARELTKVHEEIFHGRIREAIEYFSEKPVKGELTLVISGALSLKPSWSNEKLEGAILEAFEGGGSPSQIAKELTRASGWPRREVYRMITQLKSK